MQEYLAQGNKYLPNELKSEFYFDVTPSGREMKIKYTGDEYDKIERGIKKITGRALISELLNYPFLNSASNRSHS